YPFITEVNVPVADCALYLDQVTLPYKQVPGEENSGTVDKEREGFIPLELELESLEQRAIELGYKIEGHVPWNYEPLDGEVQVMYRLNRELDGKISNFTLYQIKDNLWIRNHSMKSFTETFLGQPEHFHRDGEFT